ncbi:MAG: toll/interleukin-1 receptor domain-containing protein, partial [Desulfobacterales bacterium]|nr:toll/interleukin-1 receptor domain-containing protein [Desulfobacterales bacterium]
MGKPTIFISYSHKDEVWKDRLKPHLVMLEKAGRITVWDDRKITPSGEWYPEIKDAMEKAAVAVCLISADYLASDFCVKEEIPYFLDRRKKDGMPILPVLVHPCFWEIISWVEKTQMLPRDGKSISVDYQNNWDTAFKEVAKTIFNIVNQPDFKPPPPPAPEWSPPEKVDIVRLPMTGAELFGRKKELELLDNAWESDETYVISLVAWGGVGKSTLVNKWLEKMGEDNYRGAGKVFAWSFYSQGTGERVTSADQFIREALEWFGDPAPDAGSTWNKGKRLAGLVQKEKTLLILDGLEPLQSPHEFDRCKLKDPALEMLVTGLAKNNPGLCV